MNESKSTSTSLPLHPALVQPEPFSPPYTPIVSEKPCCWRKEAILQMTMKLLEITNSKTTFNADGTTSGPVYMWIDKSTPESVIASYVAQAKRYVDEIEK